MTVDNVRAYEIVLADGRIVKADQSTYPDLYKALRGGGANFGIVTGFDLIVHPYEGMWGGSAIYKWDEGARVIDAFVEYGKDDEGNVDTHVILCVLRHDGEWIYLADLENLSAEIPTERSPLNAFRQIPMSMDLTGVSEQTERTASIALSAPPGMWNGYWTFCTQVNADILKYFFDAWREEADKYPNIEGFANTAMANINIVTKGMLNSMKRNGGNSLGLDDSTPFFVMLMETSWVHESDGEHVWTAMRNTYTRTEQEARRLGLEHEYIYMNYANPYQDVYSSYGAQAKDFLRKTSTKYDPKGMFQRQRGAGFHLHGSMVPLPSAGTPLG